MTKFAGLGLGTETPARMIITHPVTAQPLRNVATGEDAWIDLLSFGSTIAKQHDRAMQDALSKMRGRPFSGEQNEANLNEKLAKLTKAWSLVTLDGEPIDIPCTVSDARDLYNLPETSWLRDQVLIFSADLGNYPKAASTN